MTTDRPLTLDVTDFGPIARACVELRPLTVFVGPGNTGKSWLATQVYALHRHFGVEHWGIDLWFRTGLAPPALPAGAKTDLVRIAQQLTASRGAEPTSEGLALTLPIETAIRLYLREHAGPFGDEVERCFGLAGDRLVRKGAEQARILLRLAVEGVSAPAEHELTLGNRGWTFLPTIPDGIRIRGDRHRQSFEPLIPGRESKQHLDRMWRAVQALSLLVLPDHRTAHYLPADRTGLMNAHSAIVGTLIRSATMAGSARAETEPPLSGVRGDFLQQLVEMASDRRRQLRDGRERLEELGKRVEDEILRGAVRLDGLPGVAQPQFTYRPSGWESGLPLSNTSSMVSELAPVVLYLRHLVARDDLLIIDEPESHLHPAIQVAFTRQIAEIVRAGVRVILTTHSEWVLEELGNVVGRGRLADGGADNANAVSLDTRDVGVWLFQPAADRSGSTVKEIALDDETGLYPSGFANVAAALHNDWADIAGSPDATQ